MHQARIERTALWDLPWANMSSRKNRPEAMESVSRNRPAEISWNSRFSTVISGGMAGKLLIFLDLSCLSR
ncbi:hypothetical protein D3C74_493520 [compost metagenome]